MDYDDQMIYNLYIFLSLFEANPLIHFEIKEGSAQGMAQVQHEGDINTRSSDGNQELNAYTQRTRPFSAAEQRRERDADVGQNGLQGNQQAHHTLQILRQNGHLDAACGARAGIGDRYHGASGVLACQNDVAVFIGIALAGTDAEHAFIAA